MKSKFTFLLALFFIANISISHVHAQDAAVANDAATDTASANANASDETIAETCEVPVPKENESQAENANAPTDNVADPESNSTPTETEEAIQKETPPTPPVQSGPLIDLFGEQLISLKMVDETHAQIEPHYTNEALAGKKVIGVYFSADWCGPCRSFTPELVSFYDKMNKRRGKKDQFEIIWVSRCRDVKSFGQYFTHMNWLALPPEEAMGPRGNALAELLKVKGIPHLVLLDELGNVITYDARNKLPTDRSGIGFPWRNPLATVYVTLVPKSLRLMVKSQMDGIKGKVAGLLKKK